MSRSAHQRQQQKLQMQQQLLAQQQMADNEAAAAAAELFDLFCVATTMRQILGLHRNMCDLVNLRPAPLNEFYPKLKVKIRSWKAQALWKKFDARASQRVYAKGNACTGTRVLVIGAGPCGLRTAIEAQLLGAKVVVVEKRDRISRNNVLHLWPFVITDLRSLGAKKFYGKFCAGSIDHISIRQLQCILLKVALLLGVEIHEGVSFERTIEPSVDGCGWRAAVSPSNHAVSHYEFDVLIGADGKRNTLEDFKRKEFRGKLAIAITANFINKKTEAEAKAEEISGVAFIFNQSFFKELYHTTGIDLENIVYYKDETHYFVMTAKKHSLIDKGVILQDFADPAELLASANVNTEKLLDYAREAAEFSTKYQMPNLEFAVNHYGKPDVAMFDFTSMFAAESSCRVIVRKNYRLLQCLVGDSLLEPFWPTGSGCARGFLSSMDAAYVIKLWSNPSNSILGVVAQRESIYRLLNQTTPENLQRDVGSYTVDPASRYPNLNRSSVNAWQIKHLVDSDDKLILEQTFMDTNALQINQNDTPLRRKRRSGDSVPLSAILLRWICAQLHAYDFVKELKEVSDVFTHGKVLCALINRYRPDLVDFNAVQQLKPVECNELAFRILEKEMHITRIMSGKESLQLNAIESKVWLTYLEQICEVFRGEIPHIKHPKIDFSELREKYRINHTHAQPDFSKLLQLSSKQKAKSPIHDMVDVPQVISRRSVFDEDKLKRQRRHEQLMANHPNVGHNTGAATSTGQAPNAENIPRRAKKRRNADKAANIEERQKRLQDIEENRKDRLSKRRQQRYQQTQNFYKSLHMLQANTLLREGGDDNTPFEDYSIFLYRQQAPEFNDRVKELERKLLYPDRERGDIASALPRGNTDELFSDRIKSMEQRISSRCGSDKKPKDLMRAIGRIDSSDWQIREIEKKMEQSKKTEVHGPKGREKVPKWSKEQFQARQNKMAKPNRQDSSEEKYKEIDQTLKNLDKQLKEGHIMDVGQRGRNKVASIAGHFVRPEDTPEEKNLSSTSVPKSSSKVALAFKKQAVSEKCHFCKQTVYLMEKLHIEGLVMHRGCLKCHHCHTNLRLGGYAFDRDDPNGRFYCTQHFRLPAKSIRPLVRKMGQRKTTQGSQPKEKEHSPTNKLSSNNIAAAGEEVKRHAVDNITQMEMLGRGQTPERIEFENTDAMSDGEPSEEHIIDEHEWSGRNFLPESNNDAESDLSTSDESDSDSASDIYEEANDSPLGAQTLQLATDWIGKQNYTESDDSDEFYDSSEGIADDGKDDTEGEEFEKARELRREEVRLQPLPPNLPTDTETEKQVLDENQDSKKDKQLNIESSHITDKSIKCKESGKSLSSQESFKSTASSTVNGHNEKATAFKTRKTDMEKLEQHKDHKFSADIEAISQKLYRLNNIMKMNKDLEVAAKENIIRSDILKKLTMKEKWLAANNGDTTNNSLTKFEDKIEKILDTKPKKNVGPILPEKDTQDLKIEKEKANVLRSKENVADNKKKIRNSEKTENISKKQEASEVLKASAHHFKDKMQIESILDVVKSINISKNDEKLTEEGETLPSGLGDVKPNENWMNRFSDRMETIKSQIIEPTVSAQASATVDLSKYFPHEKSEKTSSPNVNKNQKTLKDVDLTKYFPSSPAPQRRTPVVTVADKLKNCQTERNLSTISTKQGTPTVATNNSPKSKIANSKMELSLKDHQLDGSADVVKKKSPIKMVTSTAVATVVKKGNVKIIKKIVPKGTKAKKVTVKIIKTTKKGTKKINTMQDDSDQLLEEILKNDNGGDNETRSPNSEYLKLFKEEKSPSEDISDKIDCILEAEGIDLGIVKKPKKLLKTKSLGEEEFKSRVSQLILSKVKEDGDEPASGVQNILKRFESMSSLKSSLDFSTFKLQRMESSTKTPLRSKETLMSSETLSQSDLERIMDYLKSEWRNEASNFLQEKRSTYFSEKLQCCEIPNEKQEMELKKKCVEQKESALPNKKVTKINKNDVMERNQAKANTKPITYTSIEELALISLSKQETLKQKRKSEKDNGNAVSQKEDNVTNKVNKTMNNDDVASLMPDNKTMRENKRPVIEDIRNLPKTGCGKSLSNSRWGSQTSIQSRTSIGELCMKGKCSLKSNSSFEEVSLSSKNERNNSSHSTDMAEEDSCNNIIINKLESHNSSAIPYHASSSEEESIEKLFSQFSDEMLVNVEFDPNDDLIAITPRVTLLDAEENKTDNLTNMETIEKQLSFTNCENNSEQHFKTPHFDEDSKHVTGFPIKSQRTQRSTSSSSDAALPANNILLKLPRTNNPPSVQDLIQQTLSIEVLKEKESLKAEDQCLRFPRILNENKPFEDHEMQHIHHYSPKVNDNDSSSTPKDESVFQFSKVLKPMPLYRESSLELYMEKLPSSPLPMRKFKINDLANEIDFMDDSTKDYNKIDKNNISGSSTGIQRTEPQLNENFQISETAAISSIQMLNNLDADSETAAHRLIKEYETERRQALALRDKQFQEMEKADLKKETTPSSSIPVEDGPMNITPIISNANKQSSRTSSQPSLYTNRDGTPPMLKTLDIGSDGPSQQSSRRSSLAFIEMIDAKPIEVPMPKKLELPTLQSNEKPVNLILAKPENMKNRPWPKAEDFHSGDEDDSEGDEKNIKEKIQYANISKGNQNSIAQNRQWPDGKTMFKPQSPAEMCKVDTVDSKKYLSDSTSDLTIAPSYHHHHHTKDSSNYHSRSSVDSDLSTTRTVHSETTPYALGKHQKTANPAILDASTRMLLDRGKRLHNRKCDFVNERAAERNPYLRDAFNEEKKSSLENSDSDDYDDLSNTYRAKTYSIYNNKNSNNNNNKTRFPTSCYIGRPNIIHRYDYMPSYSARRIPIVSSLPSPIINTASPNRNYPYSSSSVTARSLYGLQSASRHKESKDNCVLN